MLQREIQEFGHSSARHPITISKTLKCGNLVFSIMFFYTLIPKRTARVNESIVIHKHQKTFRLYFSLISLKITTD